MLKWNRCVVKKLAGGRLHRGVNLNSSLCEVFHENTKLTPLSQRTAGTLAASFLKSDVMHHLAAGPYKVYSLMDRQELPPVEPRDTVERAIVGRRSRRRYSRQAVGLDDLARLLFLTYGRVGRGGGARPIASGGALYPLEFYVTAVNVAGLEAGVYHYNVEEHCLDVIRRDDGGTTARLSEIVWLEDIETVENIGAVIFIAAFLPRTTVKYGDRGYRLVLIEAGEAVHNLGLLASQMELGCCPLGGFIDNALSGYLEIDGVDEVPLVPVVLGRPETDRER